MKSGETVDGDLVVFGGSATLESGSTVDGNVAVFGGSAVVDGTVDGDLAAMGGSVTVNGTIDGDVAAFGGSVKVNEGATVGGDMVSFGGSSSIAEGATVEGRIKDGEQFGQEGAVPPMPPVAPPAPEAPSDFNFDMDDGGFSMFGWVGRIVSEVIWAIALVIILGLIAWLMAAFMPEQMMNVRRTLSDSAALSFGVGLITMMVSIVVGIVLLITLCLAFIPVFAWIFLAIASLFGWIVIGQILGERLLVASGRPDPGLVMSSVVGVIVLTMLTKMPVVGEIPCLGWILGFVGGVIGTILSLAGMGAVLLTRFGFKEYPDSGKSAGFSGGSSPRPSGSMSSGPRVRWTDPAPVVSEEDDMPASEADLNARIKAALAEADDKPADEPDDKPKTED